MRITVDISDKVLNEVMELTGEDKKSPAISKAIGEFIKRKRAKEFGALLREGAFDYDLTNEEIEGVEKK